jgi:hypothetical protein
MQKSNYNDSLSLLSPLPQGSKEMIRIASKGLGPTGNQSDGSSSQDIIPGRKEVSVRRLFQSPPSSQKDSQNSSEEQRDRL